MNGWKSYMKHSAGPCRDCVKSGTVHDRSICPEWAEYRKQRDELEHERVKESQKYYRERKGQA